MTKHMLWTLTLYIATCAVAHTQTRSITVNAVKHDYRWTPVTVTLPAILNATAVIRQNGQEIASQVQRVGKNIEVTWIIPSLSTGQSLNYTVTLTGTKPALPTVTVVRKGANLDINVDGNLFTTYDTTTGPNKPYFFPIYGPDQKLMVRQYPLAKVAGETTDHPHHRGMWFTHGAVNGVDYWSEESKTGKTVNHEYKNLVSGPVYGAFESSTDWIDPQGKKVAVDTRVVRVYNLPDGRLMDITIKLSALDQALLLGDTKEGSFGLRVPDSIRPQSGGHIINSEGVTDAATWSKRANWVDYYGRIDGETLGVAIFDHRNNLRHPTYWHVRDYGLFAVNPFGIHDFVKGAKSGAGDHTIPAGGALTFRYRVYFHKGSASDAGISDMWNSYDDPPSVVVK